MLALVRVYDMKQTFGALLKALGVSFEEQENIFGRRSDPMETHYSPPALSNLIEGANGQWEGPCLTQRPVVQYAR